MKVAEARSAAILAAGSPSILLAVQDGGRMPPRPAHGMRALRRRPARACSPTFNHTLGRKLIEAVIAEIIPKITRDLA